MSVIDWKALGKGLVRGAEHALPVNMGMFAGTLAGDRKPITERDFDPATLTSLKKAAADAYALQAARQRNIERLITSTQKEPNYNGKANDLQRYSQWARDAQVPASLQYENYNPKATYNLNDEGWLHGIINSFTNPDWRAVTTVGRAKLERDKAGNTVVVDTHDWNWSKDVHREGVLSNLLANIGNPTTFGNVLGSLLAPQEERAPRQVRVNLGLVRPEARKYDWSGHETMWESRD
jgi:hypothetical protein